MNDTSTDTVNRAIGMVRAHGLHGTEVTLRALAAERDALERQIAAADALAEAVKPFAASLERYSGFTEYALFGIWEDVNGAAGRKLNILRKANFDDARTALTAYQATKEQRDG